MTSHARHDRFAIAAAIGGGLPPATLRTCPACGSLHRDLLSVQAAIRHAWTPRLPRDLRLDRADLERRSAGRWRRMIDVIATPFAIGLTTLGIAGLAIAIVPLAPGLASSAEWQRDRSTYAVAPSSTSSGQTTPADAPALDPRIVVSGVSLGAGGTILGIRRITSRGRAMR
jgi:hypothetical protein